MAALQERTMRRASRSISLALPSIILHGPGATGEPRKRSRFYEVHRWRILRGKRAWQSSGARATGWNGSDRQKPIGPSYLLLGVPPHGREVVRGSLPTCALSVDRGIGYPRTRQISYLRHTLCAGGTRRVYLHPRRGPDTTR